MESTWKPKTSHIEVVIICGSRPHHPYLCWPRVLHVFLPPLPTTSLDVLLPENDGVEVGAEHHAAASSVAGNAQELGARLTEVDVLRELDWTSVGEAVVARRGVSRSINRLVLAVVKIVVVEQL